MIAVDLSSIFLSATLFVHERCSNDAQAPIANFNVRLAIGTSDLTVPARRQRLVK
jgi:hypothetical protein